MWVLRALFWAMQYKNDPRYLRRYAKSMRTRRLRPKKANRESKAVAVKSRGKYRKQQALPVVTLRIIIVDEEPSLNYVMFY